MGQGQYGNGIIVYTFFYLLIGLAICVWSKKRKIQVSSNMITIGMVGVVVIGLISKIIIASSVEGFSSDIGCFKAWANAAANDFTSLYKTDMFLDYPPAYMYVLYIVGKVSKLSGMGENYTLLIKLPAILADLVTGYLLYRICTKRLSKEAGVFIAAAFIFNPVVILNSSLWGMMDSFLTLFVVLALTLMVCKNYHASAAVLSIAVLMKPQGLFFVPVLFFELVSKKKWLEFIKCIISALVVAIIIMLPFSFGQSPFWIFKLYMNTAQGYQYASLNAFSMFSLIGANLVQDSTAFMGLNYGIWGYIFDSIIFVAIGYLYLKRKDVISPFFAALMLICSICVLSSRMHERYIFPAIVLALFCYIYMKDKRMIYVFVVLTVTTTVNIQMVLHRMINTGYPHIEPENIVLVLGSLVNVIVLAYLIKIAIDIFKGKTVGNKDRTFGNSKFIRTFGNSKFIRTFGLAPALNRNMRPRRGIGKNMNVRDADELNNETQTARIDRKDIIIMFIMTAIYLAIALVNLGSTNVPETSWTPDKAGQYVEVDLGREISLSKIYSYSGLGQSGKEDGQFSILYKDTNSNYVPLRDVKDKTVTIDSKDIFIWSVDNIPTQKVRYLKILVNIPEGALNEIAFFEENCNTPVEGINIIGSEPINNENTRNASSSNESSREGKTSSASNSDAKNFGVTNLLDEQSKVDYKHSYMSGMIFDEIYHARTAYEYLNRMEPFEWTHPPLGKIFISMGIAIFGMNPFGWRIIGTLFGVAMIPLMYLFGRKLFGGKFYGFCSAFLMMFDFMHFSLSRIATIDVFATFFVILMYYYMYDFFTNKSYIIGYKKSLKPLLLCGLVFGLGVASKWIGLYAGAGLAALFFTAKYLEYRDYRTMCQKQLKGCAWTKDFVSFYITKTFAWCVVFFVVVPCIIYGLSYIPYMNVQGSDNGIGVIFRNQRDMFVYHSQSVLNSTHPFASTMWEWPIIKRPIYTYAGTDLPSGISSTMTIMGNPAIWWVGIICIIVASVLAIKRRNKKMVVVFVAIASQYLPWLRVERITFIYHYFSVVPFMILSIVYVIKCMFDKFGVAKDQKNRLGILLASITKYNIYAYLGIVFILFVMFYPVLSGMEVDRSYVDRFLLWFKGSWVF